MIRFILEKPIEPKSNPDFDESEISLANQSVYVVWGYRTSTVTDGDGDISSFSDLPNRGIFCEQLRIQGMTT